MVQWSVSIYLAVYWKTLCCTYAIFAVYNNGLNAWFALIIVVFNIFMFVILNFYIWLYYFIKCISIFYPGIIGDINENKFMKICRIYFYLMSFMISILEILFNNGFDLDFYYSFLINGKFILNSTNKINLSFCLSYMVVSSITVLATGKFLKLGFAIITKGEHFL